MARKPTTPKPVAAPKTAAVPVTPVATPEIAESPVATTTVRNTVVPKASLAGAAIKVAASKAPVPLTYERIAERAYYISRSGHAGSEHDNWLRAEAELKNELA